MRYGFYLPTRGACATADALEALLGRGERLGFVSVMIWKTCRRMRGSA